MTKNRISNRIASISESATMAVTNKARDLRAAGEPVIGFGAGEPDFPTPDHCWQLAACCRRTIAMDPHQVSLNPVILVDKTERDQWRPETSQILIKTGVNTLFTILAPF